MIMVSLITLGISLLGCSLALLLPLILADAPDGLFPPTKHPTIIEYTIFTILSMIFCANPVDLACFSSSCQNLPIFPASRIRFHDHTDKPIEGVVEDGQTAGVRERAG